MSLEALEVLSRGPCGSEEDDMFTAEPVEVEDSPRPSSGGSAGRALVPAKRYCSKRSPGQCGSCWRQYVTAIAARHPACAETGLLCPSARIQTCPQAPAEMQTRCIFRG